MFSLMMQKLLHKKWIVFCMLAGNVLLIAVAVSQPMYRFSAFQQMFKDECDKYWEEKGKWPAGFAAESSIGKGLKSESPTSVEQAVEKVSTQNNLPVKEFVAYHEVNNLRGAAGLVRDNKQEKSMRFVAMSDFADHVDILYGKEPSGELTEDGCLEVIASEAAMLRLDLLLNDTYEFSTLLDKNNGYAKIRVVGIFKIKDDSKLYWQGIGTDLQEQVFADEALFRKIFTSEEEAAGQGTIASKWFVYWDYEQLKTENLTETLAKVEKTISDGTLKSKANIGTFKNIVAAYNDKVKRVDATLSILQIPVLLLLCAFLYMISGQMLQMEQNEISLMKSRGATRGQIIGLYFLQSSFLALISFVLALPIGFLFCKFLGSSTAFLEFEGRRSLPIQIFTPQVLLYGGMAILSAIAMTTLPVIRYSSVTIVNLKQSKARKKKALWKKLYLDIVCLGVSWYGYFSYQRRERELVENVLEGEALEPLLYISSSLFILGCAFLFCRIQPWLLKLVFRMFKNRLRPASYASFLQTIRTGYRQEFIIVFMILTVAIGIFNATISRTMLANAVSNIRYLTGAEIAFAERWPQKGVAPFYGEGYIETPYEKFTTIPGVTNTSKVFGEAVNITLKGNAGEISAEIMGIDTADFAKVTKMEEGLLPYHYYEYLNVLASDRQGVLVSENFMKEFEYQLGDQIVVLDSDMNRFKGYIRGFFPYWPGYNSSSYHVTAEGEMMLDNNYLVVGNLGPIQEQMTVLPYEIWMETNDGGEGLYTWLTENPEVKVKGLTNIEEVIQEQKEDALFQGTNGILSMSFIIILLLCCTGYLIYWIMSIRSRELLFGILRAMGMRQKEITWMLVIEQIFSGLLAILAGAGIGAVSSRMFVPMIQKALAATDQMLPLQLITNPWDMVRLFAVIGAMLCVCLVVLGKIVSGMNISSALKLGED